jgi:hypothetical protein
MTWSVVPTLREMGGGAYPVIVASTLGGLCGIAELATKARYRLSPFTLAFAGVTFLAGLVSTLTGGLTVLRYLLQPAIMADAAQWRAVATQGMYEAIGGVVTGSGIAALLLVLWIVARLRMLTRPRAA